MIQFLLLVPLGFLIGAFGTLIGAGGGFILVPILLLLYPDKSPDTITSISLAVVFFNALSGSFAYSRMKRIDYKSGIIFAIATLPGSVLGSVITSYVPRQLFNGIFGVILVIVSIFLIVRTKEERISNNIVVKKGYVTRTVIDNEGTVHTFSYNPVIGIVVSVFVGFMSSFLGIGGGVIHVPVLVNILNYPVHIATATSHFVLAVMSFSGTIVHIVNGVFQSSVIQTAALSIGVLFGAQLGARLSRKIHGVAIIRSLAVALAIVGIRIIIMAF
ncbi:sulfite exporter TauE/SafE family protein [Clostridium oryzae]|uniref:Probable membrane transporter protein n=1 Tax=Clostridium oryzae TaxID=1450648 RepID=A0A1V4IKK3_9CLOT|nr:sulfite exporter TauE/SafE family protein [Clostridium oryzae]OPJ60017.1 sulfite exporter TauE/SafE [Clostridium oryzae]